MISASTPARESSTFFKLCLSAPTYRYGDGEERLSERRAAKGKEKKEQQEIQKITLKEIFEKHYFPQAKIEKAFKSHDRERGLFYNWIDPVIGKLPLPGIAPIHIEKIKKNLMDIKRSPRSITSAALTDRNDISYMSFQDIHDNPVEMEPLINSFLYKNESCLIHAPGGVGKKSLIVSYISLYLASYGTDETSNNVSALYKRRAC